MEYKGCNILRVKWFNNRSGMTGIVVISNIFEQEMAFIGTVSGKDSEDDIKNIIDYGSSFPIDAARILFGDKL